MKQFEYRQVDYIAEDSCTYSFCVDYYSKSENKEKVLLIYNEHDEYLGCLTGRELAACDGEIAFEYRQRYFTYKGYLKEDDEFCEELNYYMSILADSPVRGEQEKRFYIGVLPVETIADYIRKQRDFLRTMGILAFTVNIPDECMLKESEGHIGFCFDPSSPLFWGEYARKYITSFWDRIFSVPYKEARKKFLEKKELQNSYGEGKRRIFLVGPCIVNGSTVFEGESLIEQLYEYLRKQNIHCELMRVSNGIRKCEVAAPVLEYDIYKNDIVLFMVRASGAECDFDMTPIYKDYQGYKWLYTNIPMHTTYEGNHLLAEALVEKVISPIYQKNRVEDDDVLLYRGTPQHLTNYALGRLQEWLEGFQVISGGYAAQSS